MAKYLKVAAEANQVAQELIQMVPEQDRPRAAEKIARLVNFGIRISPRPVQSTVRINGVSASVKGLPVRCKLEERQSDRGTYKVLVTTPIYDGP